MEGPFFALRIRGKVADVDALVASVAEAADRFGVFLQAVDEAWVYDAEHAESAWVHAERAIKEGRAGSKSLGGEFLRYVTATRQAGKAITAGGVKAAQEAFVLVAAGAKAGAAVWWLLDRQGFSRDPAGVGPNEEALERLGVSEAERSMLPQDSWGDLALERVALVDLEKR
jgi:tRNA threonylcarbamoyladenosine modification (KEOPS) complex Cgi121 subunit